MWSQTSTALTSDTLPTITKGFVQYLFLVTEKFYTWSAWPGFQITLGRYSAKLDI